MPSIIKAILNKQNKTYKKYHLSKLLSLPQSYNNKNAMALAEHRLIDQFNRIGHLHISPHSYNCIIFVINRPKDTLNKKDYLHKMVLVQLDKLCIDELNLVLIFYPAQH